MDDEKITFPDESLIALEDMTSTDTAGDILLNVFDEIEEDETTDPLILEVVTKKSVAFDDNDYVLAPEEVSLPNDTPEDTTANLSTKEEIDPLTEDSEENVLAQEEDLLPNEISTQEFVVEESDPATESSKVEVNKADPFRKISNTQMKIYTYNINKYTCKKL